jgi:hypothetical protein
MWYGRREKASAMENAERLKEGEGEHRTSNGKNAWIRHVTSEPTR